MTYMASLSKPTRVTVFVTTLSLVVLMIPGTGQAQETNITQSGLNTATHSDGAMTIFIDGGTRPGTGIDRPNLFHSFGDFSIGENVTALFRNLDATGAAGTGYSGTTANIIGRVTGSHASSLFGTLNTISNFPTANLFLVNPNGIVFGANAMLNVGGSVIISTADYLKMAEAKFYADPTQPTKLSIAPVEAFGFLRANPGGTITLQHSISGSVLLIGRDRTVDGITTPGIEVTGPSGPFSRNIPVQLNLISVGQVADSAVGGEVKIVTKPLDDSGRIATNPLVYNLSGFEIGGNVLISGSFEAESFTIVTPPNVKVVIANSALALGDRAEIDINTGTLQVDGVLGYGGNGVSGPITLTAANSFTLNSTLTSVTEEFGGGPITITSPFVVLTANSQIRTAVAGTGGGLGTRSGSITMNVGSLDLSEGARINSSGEGRAAAGGAITIQGLGGTGSSANSVNIAGSITSEESNNDVSARKGGDIFISAQNISMHKGGLISSASKTGNTTFPIGIATGAGDVTIIAPEVFQSSGGTVTSTTVDGGGGQMTIQAGSISLTDGASLSASSTGSANAGSIQLTSRQDITVKNSFIETSAAQASGGNITLTAPHLIRLVDSKLESSVKGPAGSDGGNITIDPQLVVIQNSQLLANANAGAGGNITIAASGAVLVDPNSLLSATAGPAGVSGSVNINSPIQVLSGALVPLNLVYSQAGLSGDRCAADPQGQFSSFVQIGRDGVPQVPGALSPSPLSFLETLTSASLGSRSPSLAAARLGLNSVSLDDSTLFRFHSACRS